MELKDLTISMVTDFLISDKHSGSWKNNFITVTRDIYDEASFHGVPFVPKLNFPL